MIVYIKTTERCNFYCMHCYNPFVKQDLDFEQTKDFLKQIIAIDTSPIFVLHGGEPLVGNTSEILKLIHTFPDAYWRISTNLGYELTEERKQILLCMNEVRVSFDVGIRFQTLQNLLRWINNMKWLTNKRTIFCNICLSKNLLRHEPIKLLKMLDRFNIKDYAFERITLVGNAKLHQEIIPSYKDIDVWLCKIYELEKTNSVSCRCKDILNIKLGMQGHHEQCYGKQCCMNTMTINADGTIGNCPNDARENPVAKIEDGAKEAIKKIHQKKHIPKQICFLCKYFFCCRGGCEQLEWQGDICPYPKQLAEIVWRDISEQ